MAKKNYEVTFAKGTENQATYPVEANNKQDAKAAFCLMYLGKPAQALERLLTVVEVESYVEKDVEIRSMDDRQGTVNHNHQKIVVEYAGNVPNNGPITFKEVKPKEEETWLL